MRTLRIALEHLPYAELSPNSRVHFMVKARAVKAAREEVGWLAKAQWHDQEPMKYARISYEFHVKDKRHRDLDNLLAMCKPFQDALIDVGVLMSDDAKHLQIGGIKVVQGTLKAATIITVEEVPPCPKE